MSKSVLDKLASDLVGDGEEPNLFFVSLDGKVKMVTSEFTQAYKYWKDISYFCDQETTLEDRGMGVIFVPSSHLKKMKADQSSMMTQNLF